MLPREYASKKGFVFHAAGVPLFVFGMLLLFLPTGFARFPIPYPRYTFHVTILFCIVLVLMLVSRLLFLISHRHTEAVSYPSVFLTVLGEIVGSSGFSALYLWLVSGKEDAYFWFFGMMLVYLSVLMLVPYLVINLYFIILSKNQGLLEMERDPAKEKIHFTDERGNLKLVVASDAVLYVQSDENYVKICYLEYGEMKFCSLRNTMKRMEQTCLKGGLVRCHRSYFVNSARVQALQKDKEFTYAVLDVPDAHRVPVSKNYYDQLAALL